MQTLSEEEAARLEGSYRFLFEQNPLPMWVYDAQTRRMLTINIAAMTQYGFTKEGFVGRLVHDLCQEGDAAPLRHDTEPEGANAAARRLWRQRQRDGDFLEVEMATAGALPENTPGRVVLVKDLSERHRADKAEFAMNAQLKATLESITDAFFTLDRDWCFTYVNGRAEALLRRPREELLGQNIWATFPQGEGDIFQQEYVRAMAESSTTHFDAYYAPLQTWFAVTAYPLTQGLAVYFRDVTDRMNAQAELKRSRELLSELTRKLMTQERALIKSLAQTLHDHLGQTLAAIRMAHETVLSLQEHPASPQVERLQGQMGVLIGHANAQIRQVLMDLRPPQLEEQGIVAALDNELRNRSLTQPQIEISLDVDPQIANTRWPREVEYAAFMVAREAVENALRHSDSPCVSTRLSGGAASLQLEVSDKGVGMQTETARKVRHLGILSMHERAQGVGAAVEVSSVQGQGTVVRFDWKAP